MTNRRPLRALPFALAIGVAALLVLSAPFVGQLRSEIRRAFPGQFVAMAGASAGAGILAAIAGAIWSIRDRRILRYGGLVLALLIAVAYSACRAGPNPESNAVERFHFLQYGLITFLFYRAWRPLGDCSMLFLPVFAGLIVGTVEEWFQWFIPNRVGEMSDIWLNLVAIGTGLLFSVAALPPSGGLRCSAGTRARVSVAAAVALVALGAFIHVVHLGYVIDDPEIGRFESRYAAERLLALQAERTEQWKASPPSVRLVRLSREDQYLTEGIQHVRERNRLWEQGDFDGAWRENRILERYFAPVLSTPTHEGPEGHRWPPEQRADAERRSQPARRAAYVSAAYPSRLVTWHPLALWAAVCAGAAGLLWTARMPPALWRSTPGSA